MNRLIALDMPSGAAFVDSIERIWSVGDAVASIDQRLPSAARVALLRELAPDAIIDTNGSETRLPNSRPVEAGDAIVIATSGSTGAPKGVVLTHYGLTASATASNDRLGTTSNDHWLACLPLSHVGGFSVVTRAWQAKCRLTVHPIFDAYLVENSTRLGVTMTSLVATALARVDPTLFRLILVGGSSAPSPLPQNVVSTYGLTETGGGIFYDGLPLSGVDTRIAPDGEIQIKAPMLARCYRDETPVTDIDGWFNTGDIGEFGNGGLLIVHGRRADVIITGGEHVWPQQVEAILEMHPRIQDVVVRGIPDPVWGHRVVAWLTTVDGNVLSLDDARSWVKETLPAYCAPKEIHVMAALPRTSSGKIDVQQLLFAPLE
ncbi:MAG: AMP-binding protein [Ilumatobacteraceae bacterium]